jgi:hypothetical protein
MPEFDTDNIAGGFGENSQDFHQGDLTSLRQEDLNQNLNHRDKTSGSLGLPRAEGRLFNTEQDKMGDLVRESNYDAHKSMGGAYGDINAIVDAWESAISSVDERSGFKAARRVGYEVLEELLGGSYPVELGGDMLRGFFGVYADVDLEFEGVAKGAIPEVAGEKFAKELQSKFPRDIKDAIKEFADGDKDIEKQFEAELAAIGKEITENLIKHPETSAQRAVSPQAAGSFVVHHSSTLLNQALRSADGVEVVPGEGIYVNHPNIRKSEAGLEPGEDARYNLANPDELRQFVEASLGGKFHCKHKNQERSAPEAGDSLDIDGPDAPDSPAPTQPDTNPSGPASSFEQDISTPSATAPIEVTYVNGAGETIHTAMEPDQIPPEAKDVTLTSLFQKAGINTPEEYLMVAQALMGEGLQLGEEAGTYTLPDANGEQQTLSMQQVNDLLLKELEDPAKEQEFNGIIQARIIGLNMDRLEETLLDAQAISEHATQASPDENLAEYCKTHPDDARALADRAAETLMANAQAAGMDEAALREELGLKDSILVPNVESDGLHFRPADDLADYLAAHPDQLATLAEIVETKSLSPDGIENAKQARDSFMDSLFDEVSMSPAAVGLVLMGAGHDKDATLAIADDGPNRENLVITDPSYRFGEEQDVEAFLERKSPEKLAAMEQRIESVRTAEQMMEQTIGNAAFVQMATEVFVQKAATDPSLITPENEEKIATLAAACAVACDDAEAALGADGVQGSQYSRGELAKLDRIDAITEAQLVELEQNFPDIREKVEAAKTELLEQTVIETTQAVEANEPEELSPEEKAAQIAAAIQGDDNFGIDTDDTAPAPSQAPKNTVPTPADLPPGVADVLGGLDLTEIAKELNKPAPTSKPVGETAQERENTRQENDGKNKPGGGRGI